MTPWKHNTPPHRSALNFGKPDSDGFRYARHIKGSWQVYPLPDSIGEWRARRISVGYTTDLGTFPTEGLAMSACARDCKDQP